MHEHETETDSETDSETDHRTMELRIPVVYKAVGFAKVRVPFGASKEDIEDALDDIQHTDLEDVDIADPGNIRANVPLCGSCGCWEPHVPHHLRFLSYLGHTLSVLDEEHNIALITSECCSTDSAARGEEVMESDARYVGFIYIHAQDIQDVLETRRRQHPETHIGFSARSSSQEEALRIAQMVKGLLEEAHLTVEWDGSADTRLTVRDGRFNVR